MKWVVGANLLLHKAIVRVVFSVLLNGSFAALTSKHHPELLDARVYLRLLENRKLFLKSEENGREGRAGQNLLDVETLAEIFDLIHL